VLSTCDSRSLLTTAVRGEQAASLIRGTALEFKNAPLLAAFYHNDDILVFLVSLIVAAGRTRSVWSLITDALVCYT